MNRTMTVLSFSIVLATGACVADEPDRLADDADEAEVTPTGAPTLLAAIDRANGNRVEFYEDLDGDLVISEVGRAGEAPSVTLAQTRQVHPVALYRALSGGDEAPAALAECAARTPHYAAADPAAVLTLADPAPSRDRAAGCSKAWFDAHVCHYIGGDDFDWCLTNREGNHTHSEDDVNYVWAMACADVGDIEFQRRTRTWWDWDTTEWTVSRGTYRWWSKEAGAADFDFSARVRQADGNRYHVAGMGCNDDLGADLCLNLPPGL